MVLMIYKPLSLFVILFLSLLLSCCNKSADMTGDFIYFHKKNDFYCGLFLFEFDGKFHGVNNLDASRFELSDDGDFIFNPHTNSKYYAKEIPITSTKAVEVDIASFATEIRYNQFAILHNVNILNKQWSVDLYFPDDFYGNYTFEISDKQHEAFDTILSQFVSNLDYFYYPVRDTLRFKNDASSSIYLRFTDLNDTFEYFGALPQEPCEFALLFSFVAVIIQIHLPEAQKQSDELAHLDIRDRFNTFMLMDRYTGSYVFDKHEKKRMDEEIKRIFEGEELP